MKNIIAFLPLKISADPGRKDYDGNLWRARCLIESLERHLTEPLNLVVCSPAAEMQTLYTEMPISRRVTITFVDENTIIPGISAAGCPGWYKQQALTIQFAADQKRATLRLDPDIWLTRSLSEADLWRDGKTANDFWARTHQICDSETSAKLIGCALDKCGDKIGDTPFTMVPEVARPLVEHMTKRLGSMLGMAHCVGWTEIALYSLFADYHGGIERFHFRQPLHGTVILDRSEIARKRIDPGAGFFAILNSRMNLPEFQSKMIMSAA